MKSAGAAEIWACTLDGTIDSSGATAEVNCGDLIRSATYEMTSASTLDSRAGAIEVGMLASRVLMSALMVGFA